MSVRTKALPISSSSHRAVKRRSNSSVEPIEEEKSIGRSWREVFKDTIEKRTEQGMALRGFRLREGLTQKGLAEAMNKQGCPILQHHISEMENGKRPIGKDMACLLAHVLDADVRHFLYGSQ
jgi:plasmid maintenance system antidote protein VapI